MDKRCPEDGTELVKRGNRLCCDHCNYYEAIEKSKDRIVRAGFKDAIILPAEFSQKMQEKQERKRNWYASNKYNTKGELL